MLPVDPGGGMRGGGRAAAGARRTCRFQNRDETQCGNRKNRIEQSHQRNQPVQDLDLYQAELSAFEQLAVDQPPERTNAIEIEQMLDFKAAAVRHPH